jgi:hypothetical protein
MKKSQKNQKKKLKWEIIIKGEELRINMVMKKLKEISS